MNNNFFFGGVLLLSEEEAKKRLGEFGLNEIGLRKKKSIFSIFISQYKDVFSLVLVGAAVVSFFLAVIGKEDFLDSILIIAILFVNGVVGTFQQYKSERVLEMLRNLNRSYVLVKRDGKLKKIDSRFLVPGDLVVLEEGDKVPADLLI